MAFEFFRRLLRLLRYLKLGLTLQKLKYTPHPWFIFWTLFWPIPWKCSLPTLLDPLDIRDHPEIVHQRYYIDDSYKRLQSIPLFQLRDTPLRSLYRLHDALCVAEENYVMLEGYYFWNQSQWRVKDIPDPKDPNPLRYAILASLVESMVEAFNWKISIGLRRGLRWQPRERDEAHIRDPNKPFEEVPSWALHVPPVEEWISFLPDRSMKIYGTQFYKRHICADTHQLEMSNIVVCPHNILSAHQSSTYISESIMKWPKRYPVVDNTYEPLT